MPVTKKGKPTAWAVVQLVEERNGDVSLWLLRSGPSRAKAEAHQARDMRIKFDASTGLSGVMAHRKLRGVLRRENPGTVGGGVRKAPSKGGGGGSRKKN